MNGLIPLRRARAEGLEARAHDVARLLKTLANTHRLLILCTLVQDREASVGELVATVGLSQSALSQHLALMREDGLVTFRREGQLLFYRLADKKVVALLDRLHDLYCKT